MELAEKKGMGTTGIFLTLCIIIFFFTMFYVVLNHLYNTMLPNISNNADTLSFFNTYMKPEWMVIPLLFMISIVLGAVIQGQFPFAMFSIGGMWIMIIFTMFSYSMIFVAMDRWMMTDLPALLPSIPTYSDLYTDFIKPLWRTSYHAIYVLLMFIGVFLAPTYFEGAGRVYRGRPI